MSKHDELMEKFDNIAEDAIGQAEQVNCSFGDFVEGLRVMYETIGRRYHDARDEHRSQE